MHRHPANRARHDGLTWAERLPDQLTAAVGTMQFIYWSSVVIGAWIALNVVAMVQHWDPYPFQMLNLWFSAFAFYSSPLILMAQNRQTEHDRIRAEHDYGVNEESLAWSRAIGSHLGVDKPVIPAQREGD